MTRNGEISGRRFFPNSLCFLVDLGSRMSHMTCSMWFWIICCNCMVILWKNQKPVKLSFCWIFETNLPYFLLRYLQKLIEATSTKVSSAQEGKKDKKKYYHCCCRVFRPYKGGQICLGWWPFYIVWFLANILLHSCPL